MEKKAVSGIMLTLLLTSMLMLAFNVQPVKAEPRKIIVPDDYAKIQWAIGNATEGDTIIVRDGTYTENIWVQKSLTIKSENGAKVTIVQAANPHDDIFEVTADYVSIIALTVKGASEAPSCGILLKSSGNNIANNIISNNYWGILSSSGYNNIMSNTILNNHNGILLTSDNNTIKYNNVSYNNMSGICLSSSRQNSITNNIASYNLLEGILMQNSNSNVVASNIASYNDQDGIRLEYSFYNSVINNTASSNRVDGILLIKSIENTVMENNISYNGDFGIGRQSCYNNKFYHNNFICNTHQVAWYDGLNIWDDGYPSGGNYWSDYRERYPDAKEIDGSGIWDTPYVIDENNQDNYPLMNPWTPTPPPAIRYVITTDTIKVRAYPGKPDDGNVITMLRKGSVLQIVEHIDNGKYADGYHWWYVKFGTGSTDGVLRGWVAGEFLGEYEFPKEPKERKSVRFTAYNVALESEFIEKIAKEYPEKFDPTGTKEVKVKIYDPYWKYIGEESRTYNRAFLYSDLGVSMEGSGRDTEGRLIKCRAKVPDAFTWKERWILDEGKVEFFELRVWPLFPWDASNGKLGYLSPWYSIAVKGVVPEGSIVYVPQLACRRLSSGAVMDGYFVAVDTGVLKEDQIDLFVGAGETAMKDWYKIIGELGDRFDIKYHEIRWPLIRAKLESHGELRVYDSHGRVTGLVNGEIRTEIPDSSYDYIDNAVTIVFPTDSYWYMVAGTSEGLYGLTVTSVTEQEIITFVAIDIPTSANAIHQCTIDWDALSRGEEGVTVQIDSDGDGMFERTFTSDSDLTQSEYVTAVYGPMPVPELSMNVPIFTSICLVVYIFISRRTRVYTTKKRSRARLP